MKRKTILYRGFAIERTGKNLIIISSEGFIRGAGATRIADCKKYIDYIIDHRIDLTGLTFRMSGAK